MRTDSNKKMSSRRSIRSVGITVGVVSSVRRFRTIKFIRSREVVYELGLISDSTNFVFEKNIFRRRYVD